MQGYLRIKQGILIIFGISFTSLLLFEFFVPWFLRAFPLMCYNQIGQHCVAPTGWFNLESLFVFTLQLLVFVFLLFSFSLVGGFLILLLYFLFLSIYLFVVSYQKKIVETVPAGNEMKWSPLGTISEIWLTTSLSLCTLLLNTVLDLQLGLRSLNMIEHLMLIFLVGLLQHFCLI